MSYFQSLVKFHAGQNHTTKMGNEPLADMTKFKRLGNSLTSQITFMKKLRADGT
jgi:hypothetical protein